MQRELWMSDHENGGSGNKVLGYTWDKQTVIRAVCDRADGSFTVRTTTVSDCLMEAVRQKKKEWKSHPLVRRTFLIGLHSEDGCRFRCPPSPNASGKEMIWDHLWLIMSLSVSLSFPVCMWAWNYSYGLYFLFYFLLYGFVLILFHYLMCYKLMS